MRGASWDWARTLMAMQTDLGGVPNDVQPKAVDNLRLEHAVISSGVREWPFVVARNLSCLLATQTVQPIGAIRERRISPRMQAH